MAIREQPRAYFLVPLSVLVANRNLVELVIPKIPVQWGGSAGSKKHKDAAHARSSKHSLLGNVRVAYQKG